MKQVLSANEVLALATVAPNRAVCLLFLSLLLATWAACWLVPVQTEKGIGVRFSQLGC